MGSSCLSTPRKARYTPWEKPSIERGHARLPYVNHTVEAKMCLSVFWWCSVCEGCGGPELCAAADLHVELDGLPHSHATQGGEGQTADEQ